MANWSAFTFGGYDPLGTKIEQYNQAKQTNVLSRKAFNWHKKTAQFDADLQHQMAIKYANEIPSANVQGYRDAGLNPLLVAQGGFNGATMADVSGASGATAELSPVHTAGGDSKLWFGADRASARAAKAEAEVAQQYAEVAKIQLKADRVRARTDVARANAEDDAWLGGTVVRVSNDPNDEVAGRQGSAYQLTRQNEINALERQNYTGSKAHAIGEDTVNAVHGGSSAFQQFSSGAASWRARRKRP